MDEPLYRVYLPEPVAPSRRGTVVPGRWVAEEAWPSPRIEPRSFFLGAGILEERESGPAVFRVASPQTTGAASGGWCPFGSPEELPSDQRPDDARSLVFDSVPLRERFEILGSCELLVRVACDSPGGLLAARIEDVFPDGESARVTYGLLDLTHRDGHERPRALVPGQTYEITLRFKDAAYAFVPGHRVRLALSTAYWPIAWPPPWQFSLTVHARGSCLRLPVRPPRAEDSGLRSFEEPESAPELDAIELQKAITSASVSNNDSGGLVYRFVSDVAEDGLPVLTRIEDTRIEHGHSAVEEFTIKESDPLSAKAEVHHDTLFRRDEWSARVRTRTRMILGLPSFPSRGRARGLRGRAEDSITARGRSVPEDKPRVAGDGSG